MVRSFGPEISAAVFGYIFLFQNFPEKLFRRSSIEQNFSPFQKKTIVKIQNVNTRIYRLIHTIYCRCFINYGYANATTLSTCSHSQRPKERSFHSVTGDSPNFGPKRTYYYPLHPLSRKWTTTNCWSGSSPHRTTEGSSCPSPTPPAFTSQRTAGRTAVPSSTGVINLTSWRSTSGYSRFGESRVTR